LRRRVFRTDGIVSVHAPYAGGELVTKPIVFTSACHHFNFEWAYHCMGPGNDVGEKILLLDGTRAPAANT
jgi:hypothetical protein